MLSGKEASFLPTASPRNEGSFSSRALARSESPEPEQNKPGYTGLISEEDRNSYIAAGKAMTYLGKMEFEGSCGLEKGSVYGAAIAIPQIARSAGWPGSMLALMSRTYLFLFLNIVIQIFLLTMIGEENHIMANFAGQMHLCSFGATMEDCPGGPDCIGPRGTTYTPARLYDYGIWSTRAFVHDSLKALFPHKAEEIDELVDPGEYGMENWYCRVCCLFIFTMATYNDLRETLSLMNLLWAVPSKPEKWLSYTTPEFHEDKEEAKKVHGWTELDLVEFHVCGMPNTWKAVNLVIIAVPKLVIWAVLVSSGFHFLMETATITNLIVNSMALAFILSIDEMIFEAFSTVAVKHMMEKLTDHVLFEAESEEIESEDDVLQRYTSTELGSQRVFSCYKWIIPRRLIFCLLLMGGFYWKYYAVNCILMPDGSWVSQPLLQPEGVGYNFFGFLVPSSLKYADTGPLWSMPEAT